MDPITWQLWATLVIGLIVGVVPSMLVLFLREKKFEPNKWKKDSKLKNILQKLEIYSMLNTLLESGQRRAKRQKLQDGETLYVLLVPTDYDVFRDIFGRCRHLLSDDLIDSYFKLVIEADTFFLDVSSTESSTSGEIDHKNNGFKVNLKQKTTTVILADLQHMHTIAKNEYLEIKKEYSKLIS